METKYPKYTTYEKIYKRFFKRDVTDLISLAHIEDSDTVLDICGGNARLSKELLKYSQNVSYLDQEKDMIPENLQDLGITVYNISIQDFVKQSSIKYDKVFCQQAINYWLLDINMKDFSNLFKNGSLFIFNTFSNKPNIKPMIKEYTIENKKYIEISYLIDDKVYHIQIMEGYEPYFTIFDYIDESTYHKILSPYFDVTKQTDGKTSIYICRRK
ncbi:MAG: hypothetical protein Q4D02_08130 [Clostridia bacterium]|nr:hypothetical protein [Clostridia bacterium]